MPRLSDDKAYEDFIADIEGQLEGFRKSEEPAHEFARRLVGQLQMYVEKQGRRQVISDAKRS